MSEEIVETGTAPEPKLDRSAEAVVRRRERIRELGRSGVPVNDIAKEVGIGPRAIADMLAQDGIRIAPKSKTAVKERRERMRKLAKEGWSSKQIAADVGLTNERVRDLLLSEGFTFSTDVGVAGTHRRFDPNRIVSQIVDDAEGMVGHLAIVDVQALDATQVKEWSSRFTGAVRALRMFSHKLKAARPV